MQKFLTVLVPKKIKYLDFYFARQSPSPIMCPSPEYMFSPPYPEQAEFVEMAPAAAPRPHSALASPGPFGPYFVGPPHTPPVGGMAGVAGMGGMGYGPAGGGHVGYIVQGEEQGPSTADIIAAQGQDYVDERLAEYQATIQLLQGRYWRPN